MGTQQESRKLNRYTSLPILLDLLRRRKIVLVDPSTWEDRNDADIIKEYQNRKKVSKLFTVCLSIGDETIHHWKTYAGGNSGCCIEFDEKKLLASLQGIEGVRWGDVDYKKISEVLYNPIKLDNIPFTKRWPYRCDYEFRILWEGETSLDTMEIDIDLSSINRITLTQKMYDVVSKSIQELLREKLGNRSIKIVRSTLYENRRWIKAFEKRKPQ